MFQISNMYIMTFLEGFLLIGMSSQLSKLLIVYTEIVQLPRPASMKQTVIGIITGSYEIFLLCAWIILPRKTLWYTQVQPRRDKTVLIPKVSTPPLLFISTIYEVAYLVLEFFQLLTLGRFKQGGDSECRGSFQFMPGRGIRYLSSEWNWDVNL